MQVYGGLDEVGEIGLGRVVAMGVFDGVHLGHRRIIVETVGEARKTRSRAGVITFSPHPDRVIKGTSGPRLLTTQEQKARLLSDLGVEEMLVVRFDREFSLSRPEEFCESVLSQRLGVRMVLVGEGFRFGRDGVGTSHTLERLGRAHGFDTKVVSLVEKDGGLVSSTRIRALLGLGDVEGAARLLGRPYRLEGTVAGGSRRGRTLGAPTANVEIPSFLARPRLGVYITRTFTEDGAAYASVTVVGTNPTFEQKGRVRSETFLLDFAGDLNGALLGIDFLRRLRPQRKFENQEALAAQIAKDIEMTREAHLQIQGDGG